MSGWSQHVLWVSRRAWRGGLRILREPFATADPDPGLPVGGCEMNDRQDAPNASTCIVRTRNKGKVETLRILSYGKGSRGREHDAWNRLCQQERERTRRDWWERMTVVVSLGCKQAAPPSRACAIPVGVGAYTGDQASNIRPVSAAQPYERG